MLKVGELATDVGSVVYGDEAVKIGLIDSLGGLSDALEYLHKRISEKREKSSEKDSSEKKSTKKDSSGKKSREKNNYELKEK